jgi:cysteine synthase B
VHPPDPAALVPPQRTSALSAAAPPIAEPSILSAIGNTPLLRLARIGAELSPRVELWAKAEFLNPTGSVKDRAAWGIVASAIRQRALGPGRTLVDASSGNTGVAYAMLGARFGFDVELFLPANVSADRASRIRSYGAGITFTPAIDGTDGAQRAAKERARSDPERYFYPDQYNNPENPRAHYRTTGPEILEQTGSRITHLIAGVGTGGTLSGTARYLKGSVAGVRIVGVQPDGPIHGIEGLKHIETALRPSTYDETLVHETAFVQTERAQAMTRRLSREEGLLVGTSSGAAVEAALGVGRPLKEAVLVVILPDRGERTADPTD